MRRRDLVAVGARVLRKLERAGAGRGVDVVEMHDPLRLAVGLDHLERDVVILVAFEPGAQRPYLHRVAEAHLDARVVALEVVEIGREHAVDHLERERALGVLVEGPHDAAHVDALLVRLQRHRAGHRRLERDVVAVAGVEADGQAEVRDADVLDLGLGALDQALGAVLQVGQRRDVGRDRRGSRTG
jgi:hypothetical protein